MKKNNLIFVAVTLLVLLSSCTEKIAPVHIDRFEQALFKGSQPAQSHFDTLSKKYGLFYKSFAEDMLNISREEERFNFAPSLTEFVKFPTILQLKKEVDSVYPDLNDIEAQLSLSMHEYHHYFPLWVQPKFISFISEFGFANVTYDSIIGIGLDMYLGNNYKLYHALEFPDFMIAKLRREYIVPNALRAIAIGKFEQQLKDKRFIAMMLFEGKVKYFTKKLLPETNDSLIFGCSTMQLQWCNANQQMIWAHFIEKKLLYSSEVGEYMRYFNDGPFTIATDVPQESAPAIGTYIGYRIVEKYMNEHPEISLQQLMEKSDWDQILQMSAYRP